MKGGHNKRLFVKGQKFNSLTIESLTAERHNRQLVWLCKCECGNFKKLTGSALSNNKTKSCGCLKNKPSVCWKGCGDLSGSYWYMVQCHARTKGHPFSISIDQAWDLFVRQKGLCALSGVAIGFARNYRGWKDKQTASLDRIDSARGYEPDNIQWVHKRINDMKSNMADLDFVQWCRTVSKYQESKL